MKKKKQEIRFSVVLRNDILQSFLQWKERKEAERGIEISHQQALNEIIHLQTSSRVYKLKKKKGGNK